MTETSRNIAPAARSQHLRLNSTGDAQLDAQIHALLDQLRVTANRDQLQEMLVTVAR